MDIRSTTKRPVLPMIATTVAAFVAAYLLTRHLNHLWPLLPYALLLACPLMHLLHHRHRHHRTLEGDDQTG